MTKNINNDFTLATVNHYAKPFGCKLVHNKKEGSFYWKCTSEEQIVFDDPTVMVNDLHSLVLSEWISDLVHKIDNRLA